MARLLLAVLAVSTVAVALPAAAQQRRSEAAEQAGLRYLNWPGRPPVNSAPRRAERAAPPRPIARPTPQPQVETPAQEPVAEVRAATDPQSRPASPTATSGDGVRYYSVHRPSGRTPDTIERAQELAAEDALVALQSPQGQSLAEQDRSARAEEAFEILRNLPPDQLMDMLGRQP
ncbi:MAG TPA: hypothetical protein PLE81_06655 [Brevundimonas sp.]|jgi:hypothetical protein|uniref:hypothetical protein n=1 Tax=Brevundimonas sp. TaxID=1871086 RepID=UPI002C53EDCD|nr:hypothetical protein [Brevundimonas sp.]HRH20306.1 hypothetical protein [Brevundimonas sp.]